MTRKAFWIYQDHVLALKYLTSEQGPYENRNAAVRGALANAADRRIADYPSEHVEGDAEKKLTVRYYGDQQADGLEQLEEHYPNTSAGIRAAIIAETMVQKVGLLVSDTGPVFDRIVDSLSRSEEVTA